MGTGNCSSPFNLLPPRERLAMKTMRPLQIGLALYLLTLVAFAQSPAIPKPPDTPKRLITDEYHGVKVTDDYRWLENWDDPAVKQWSAAENARTREYLDHLPARAAVKERLHQLIAASSAAYYDLQFRGGTLFAMKYQPPQQQPMLVAMPSADDPASAKVVFDPNAASAKGSLSVEFYIPSLDGKYVAVALSEAGSEDCSAHVFDVATGKELSDVVPRVNFATAGGSLDWKADGTGFYYTRYPQGNERPPEDANFYQQVYFHKLGTDPKEDTYVIGKDFPRIAEIQLHTSEDGRWLLAAVANGDGGQYAHYIMDYAGHWTQITHFEDGIVSIKFGVDAALYLLSRKDAPRGQILRLPLTHLDLAQAKVLVPQSRGSGTDESARASIENFIPAPGHLYVIDIMGGPSRVRVFDDQGHALAPRRCRPSQPSARSSPLAEAMCSSTLPPISIRPPGTALTPPAASPRAPRCYETSPVKFDDAEVVRDFAISKDGTRVPLNIIRRKGTKLDGTNPVLLDGYGGYGISMKPFFVGSTARVWLDQGGIYVHPPTFAAAANTAKNGTRPATSPTSRMSSTTSSPVPNTSSTTSTPRRPTLPSSVAAMAAC